MRMTNTFRTKRTMLHMAASLSVIAALTVSTALPSFAETERHTHFGREHNVMDSSVKVPQETVSQAMQAARDAFNRVLTPFARITPEAAKAAALKEVKGSQCQEITLHVMRQNLVYIALLTKPDARYMVIIDAGNGKILGMRQMHMKHHAQRF